MRKGLNDHSTQDIIATLFLPGFFRLDIGSNDGTTDPVIFLSNFQYIMMNRECTPTHIYRIFPEYLKGDANHWVNLLLKNNIYSFMELATSFFGQLY